MTRKPLVSIVIPLYNKARFVLQTLRSAAGQIGSDAEIIVVDDGSTDDGARLVKAAGLSGLRLIEQPNAGVSVARNRGILAAQGKWIAFLDADDLWDRKHLAGLVEAAEAGTAIVAFSNVGLESRRGRPLIDEKVPAQTIDDYFGFALANGGYPIGSPSSVLALRNELVAAGLFAVGVAKGEDLDLWCRLAVRGGFVYNARLSATYNDAESSSRIARSRCDVMAPLFAERLPAMIREGRMRSELIASSRRYANFLYLEYARQLLDCGELQEARGVLLKQCRFSHDPLRFTRRLLRTWSAGRVLFELSRSRARA